MAEKQSLPPRLHFQQRAAALLPRNHSPHCSQEISNDPGRPQPRLVPRGWPPSPRVQGTLKPSADPPETVPLPPHCRNRDPKLLCPIPPPLQKVGRMRQGKAQRCEQLLRLAARSEASQNRKLCFLRTKKVGAFCLSLEVCWLCEGLSHHQ